LDIQLSQETETALRKLAREIGRSRGLGEDTQEELYGHLEDKTLGYLSGEENLSEADAVLLTREHFGDPGAFPELGVKAELFRSSVSLSRRMAAAAVLTLAVSVIFSMANLLIALCLETPSAIALFDARSLSTIWVRLALNAGVIFVVLRIWLARERRGSRVWYQDCSPSGFALMILALIALRWCIPIVHVDSAAFTAYLEAFLYSVVNMPRSLYRAFLASQIVLAMLPALLWVWWADRQTLSIKTVSTAVAAWIGLSIGTVAIVLLPSIVFGYPIYSVGDTTSAFSFMTSAESGAAIDESLKDTSQGGFAATALVMRAEGYRLAASAVYPCVAALLYLVVGFSIRFVRRYGGMRVRLRPAAR
jgi:hypothetical protein